MSAEPVAQWQDEQDTAAASPAERRDEQIRRLKAAEPGLPMRDIAERIGCSLSTVSAALKSAPRSNAAPVDTDKANQLASLLASLSVNPEQVREIATNAAADLVEAYLANRKPDIRVRTFGRPEVVISGANAAFDEALQTLDALGVLWLYGPAGTGKTRLAADLAKATSAPRFVAISCTAGMSETWFLGRPTIDGRYIPAPFVECFEQGGTVLLDEADAADPNVLLVINSALANGHLYLPSRHENPTALRHADFRMIVATNTLEGASAVYTGREGLDAATRDRFTLAIVDVNYDPNVEGGKLGGMTDPLAVRLWQIRQRCTEQGIRRIVSTRAFEQAAALRLAGMSDARIENRLLAKWTPEEKRKVSV